MSHVTITPEGAICYRSKNMTMSRAAAFARMMDANSDRFTGVEIKPGQTKRFASFFVQFQPVNPERRGDLYAHQLEERIRRAETEGLDYVFWPDPDHPGSHWCFNPLSGETYQVETFSCSCPDYAYRCMNAGLLCKHQQALSLQRERGLVGKTDKVSRTASDRAALNAKVRQNISRDF